MDSWFTLDKIDPNTYIISEYRHWEETHCYLLNGKFPLPDETIKGMVIDQCDLPDGFDVDSYELFHGSGTFSYGDWGLWLWRPAKRKRAATPKGCRGKCVSSWRAAV